MSHVPTSFLEALQLTTSYHNDRRTMRDKWRELGSPQSHKQRHFVNKFFEPLYFFRAYKHAQTTGFSNYSLHPVTTELGTFPTSEAAYQAYKDPTNNEYIEKQKNAKSPAMSKYIGKHCKLRDDWDNCKIHIMYNVLSLKIKQNPDVKHNLINTGLRPLIEHTRNNYFWGDGGDGSGKNNIGKLLCKIRNKLYKDLNFEK